MTRTSRIFLILLLAALLVISGSAFAQEDNTNQTAVEFASDTPDLSVFVQMVEAANLGNELESEGPFTVFIPTNGAIAGYLLEQDLTQEDLLNDSMMLRDVLLYHVVEGALDYNAFANFINTGEDITDGDLTLDEATGTVEFNSLQGEPLTVDLNFDNQWVLVNDGRAFVISTAYVENGIVHIIDDVLLMPDEAEDVEEQEEVEEAGSVLDIVEDATLDSAYFLRAVEAAGLEEQLSGVGPYTVFAPTNGAFDNFLIEQNLTLDQLLQDSAALQGVLMHHVAEGAFSYDDIAGMINAQLDEDPDDNLSLGEMPDTVELVMLDGSTLSLSVNFEEEIILINGAEATAFSDLEAGNGVIHLISTVLTP